MRMYFDIAAVVSLFSVIGIFAMLYVSELKRRHMQDLNETEEWRKNDEIHRRISDVEREVNDRINDLSQEIGNAMDSRPRTRK